MPHLPHMRAALRQRALREHRADPFDMQGRVVVVEKRKWTKPVIAEKRKWSTPTIKEERKRGRPAKERFTIAVQMRRDYPDFATLNARLLKQLTDQYGGDRKTIKAALIIAREEWDYFAAKSLINPI
jgi:hypothetical protein